MTVTDLATAIRPVLAALGITGELDIRFEDARAVSWIGPPSEDDKLVTIVVSDLPTYDGRKGPLPAM